MDFIQFLFQIFLFMLEENIKGLKVCIKIMINKCYSEISQLKINSNIWFFFGYICEVIQGTAHTSHYHI
jgi:hypothetical protein